MNNLRIAILGSGSMGTAILDGLLAKGTPADHLAVSTKSLATANALNARLGVHAYSQELDPDANTLAVDDADVVLVAVKPAYVTEVLAEVAKTIKPSALVISVAAGITTAAMEAALPAEVAVVRAMPNTPAIVGRAMTGISAGSRANEKHLTLATELFEAVGKTMTLDESQIDALSTISGSGPAYVFFLIEQLTKAAEHQGFNHAEAAELVNETFRGAVELLLASGKSPADLRKQVTSPNGTTMQAIAHMEQAHLDQVFSEATDAALRRAREIAAGK